MLKIFVFIFLIINLLCAQTTIGLQNISAGNKDGYVLSYDQINFLIIGNIVGFIVALIAIKTFIDYLTKHGFKWFGYYRIAAGISLLIMHFFVQKLTLL